MHPTPSVFKRTRRLPVALVAALVAALLLAPLPASAWSELQPSKAQFDPRSALVLPNQCEDLAAAALNFNIRYENPLDPADPDTVRSILGANCSGCHGNVTGVIPPETDGQLNLDDQYAPSPLADLLGDSGLGKPVRRQPSPWLRIDLAQPARSMLYLMTNCIPPAPYPSDPPRVMPPLPLPPLSLAERALIYDWIVEGARGPKQVGGPQVDVPASDVIFRTQLESARFQ